MKIAKLGTCLAAASITLAGSTYLASPAAASAAMSPCSASQLAYADAYGDGYCAANGYSGGNTTSCSANSDGSFSFTGTCS